MLPGKGMRQLQVLLFLFCFSGFLHAQPLRIGVSESILSLPFYVAQAQNLFQKQGVDVAIVNCVGGYRCLRNMLKGETDLSTATELPVVFNSFTRSDFAILTSFVSTSNDVKILANGSANIQSAAGLKNKRLGYIKGTASQYVLDLVLVYNGIDPATVTLKPITPETSLSALARGEVDALSIWEPFASRIQQEMGTDVKRLTIPKLYTETFNLIAMKPVTQARPDELKRVLQALKDSTDYISKYPDRAKALLAERLGLSPALVNAVFNDYRFHLSLNRSLSRTMEGQARWAQREEHVDGLLAQPNYSDYLYSTLLKKVDPGAVSLP